MTDQQLVVHHDKEVHQPKLDQVLSATLKYLRKNNALKADLEEARQLDHYSKLLKNVANRILELDDAEKPFTVHRVGSGVGVDLRMNKLHLLWDVWKSVWDHYHNTSEEVAKAAWKKFVSHGDTIITAL